MSAGAGMAAVVAAAGSGERLGAGGPKAFVTLAGRPMIEFSLAALAACEAVGSIVVAVPPGHDHDLPDRYGARATPLTVVDGGATRAASVAGALAATEAEIVAVHDAARPLLAPDLLRQALGVLEAEPAAAAVVLATPVADTIKRVGADRVVEATEDRSLLWAAQTPQVFRAAALREALAVPDAVRDAATDEAMLIERAGGRVLVHPGSPANLKVTTRHDLELAELLLAD